ncbi:hypothetical protein J2Z66_005638 [Paenibacillus eucommiae]|uniref:Uncharacterized protein n=1 Tax=Paenibacillus eucommiae TaxID=1355755 RepID=A0ABS4J2F2_9BACL|nr:hypothetical protein [Paenibacillus eucommiae]
MDTAARLPNGVECAHCVHHLTMFFIVKVGVSALSVTLMMIFIVKRGRIASQGG